MYMLVVKKRSSAVVNILVQICGSSAVLMYTSNWSTELTYIVVTLRYSSKYLTILQDADHAVIWQTFTGLKRLSSTASIMVLLCRLPLSDARGCVWLSDNNPSYTTSRSSLEFSSVGTPLKLNLFGHYKRLRLWYSLVSCSLDWLWMSGSSPDIVWL